MVTLKFSYDAALVRVIINGMATTVGLILLSQKNYELRSVRLLTFLSIDNLARTNDNLARTKHFFYLLRELALGYYGGK